MKRNFVKFSKRLSSDADRGRAICIDIIALGNLSSTQANERFRLVDRVKISEFLMITISFPDSCSFYVH